MKVKVLIGVVIVFCLAVCVSSSIQQDSKDIDSESLNIDKTGIPAANKEEIGIESSHDKNETSKSKKYDISILKRLEKDEDSTKQSQAKEDYSATVLVYIKPEYIENNKLKQNKRFNEVIENIAENLKSKGLRVTKNSANPLVVEISSFNELETLKNLGFVGYIRDGELPLAVPANSVLSEGVNKVNAPFTWDKGYNGAGTKIGVLDMGFSNWETLKSQGELPQNTYLYPPDGEGSGVHGSACAEICYDTAPGVSGLYLANEGLYTIETLNAVKWLRNQGVDVISRSVGNFGWWPSQFDSNDDGESEFWDIYKIVEYAIDNNLVWVNGAGNNRDTHWEGSWKDNDSDGVLDFYKNGEDSAYIENDREQIQVTLEGGKEFYACVRWDDYPYPSNGPTNDFDVYLDCWIGGGWVTVDRSIYSQNGTFGQEPLEIIYYIPSFSGERDCALKVEKYDASNADLMHFDVWWGGQSGYWNYNDSSYEIVNESGSIIFPADHPNVISVGAVPWDDFTSLEHYSSIGPAYNPYLGVNGLIKPDLVAPDRVSTATYSGIFEGTSAAAPHVAGVAALLLSSNSSLTPADVKQKLEESSEDLGASGKDNYFGSGLVNASNATPFPPIPSFSFTPSNPLADEEIEFDASSSYDPDGQITSYEWDFGDGGTGTGMTANHSYDSNGSYPVKLTLIDDDGLKNSKTRNIEVGGDNVSSLWVDDDAGCGGNSPCYTSIQDAIDVSSTGDTITVRDGTYHENVGVDKQIKILSENGSANCIVDAGGSGNAITLSTDGITVEGLTITGSGTSWGDSGVEVGDGSNNTVTNNNISGNNNGIRLGGTIYFYNRSGNNTISNNNISGNNNYGIYLEETSRNNTISNNNISGNNDDGIYLWDSDNNTVTNNNISGNNDDGIYLYGSDNNIITSNTVFSNYFGVYLYNSHDSNISDNHFSNNYDGMYLYNSHNNNIFENHINDNKDDGVTFSYSSNKLFSNQIYNNSDKGILLGESVSKNLLLKLTHGVGHYQYAGGVMVGVTYNLFYDNSGGAGTVEFEASAGDSYDNETFYIESCRMYKLVISVGLSSYGSGTLNVNSNASSSYQSTLSGDPTSVAIKEMIPLETHMCGNNITLNQVYNNQWGIYLNSSYNNLIYFNDFRENTHNFWSRDSDNMWNSTKQKAYSYNGDQYTSYVGNYWSDYTGVDGEEDGVGDTPYSINGDRDDYPLMQPFKNYFSEAVPGDANSDGEVTAGDALLYLRYAVGQDISPYQLGEDDDVTCDGEITAGDALKVLRKAVGQEVDLTC